MKITSTENLVSLDTDRPIWDRFFTVAPLVVIGTKEGEQYDLAPKHMATPLGWDNYFGFVCTPKHRTYWNVKDYRTFTVSFPWPNQTVITSLTASPRHNDMPRGSKPVLQELPTIKAQEVDGIFLRDSYLFLECELVKIIDGFGTNSLITGQVIAAQVHESALRTSEQEDQQLLYQSPLLAYLNPGRFATIQDTNAFPFPANFEK